MTDVNTITREIMNSQGSAEWYTPSAYIEAARFVMGGIELDPASSAEANKIVRADRYFTKEDDGLAQPWVAKTLYLNAPGRQRGSGQAVWQKRLIQHYLLKDVEQAIMCVFNASAVDTAWFHELLGNYPICVVRGRIKFVAPAGKYDDPKKSSPVHGNAFVYFGPRPLRFTIEFSRFGKVIPAWMADHA